MDRMAGLYLVTEPAYEPVTVEEVKDHLRIDITTDDTLISNMITAARQYCEEIQGRAYLTQTWDWYMDDFPKTPIDVPYPPLQSVTHIKYTDTDDTETEVDSDDYRVDIYSEPGRINLAYGESWPSTTLKTINGVVIRFVAGWTGANKVKERTKIAIKMLVGHLYENREAFASDYRLKIQEVPLGLQTLIDVDRIYTFK